MNSSEKYKKQQEYDSMVKKASPNSPLLSDCIKAFVSGGLICSFAQVMRNWFLAKGLSQDDTGLAVSLILIGITVLLTGFGLFGKIGKFCGAGTVVPITGFANSVAAPAIEYKKEGQVFGIGCKIFTIAGPVILYGVFTSWVLGLLYWIGTLIGIV